VRLSHSDTSDDLKRLIEGRISAFAQVHGLFVQSRWTGAELHNLVTQELSPYYSRAEGRVKIDGPPLMLELNAAQTIAISLHELAQRGKIRIVIGRGWPRRNRLVPDDRRRAQFALDRVRRPASHPAHAPRIRHPRDGKHNCRPAQG
jgi:hypothetical protein